MNISILSSLAFWRPGAWVFLRPAQKTLRALACLYLFVLPILNACSVPERPGQLQIIDNTESLQRERIRQAAKPLVDQAANLAVIMAAEGQHDALPALQELAMVKDGSIVSRGIAIYISLDPRYSELRVGQPWSDALPADQLRQIRINTLNPALQAGDPTAAVEATLAQLSEAITAYENRSARNVQIVVAALGLIVSLIMLQIVGPQIAATSFGQTLARFWEHTPIGQRQARQRLKRDIDTAYNKLLTQVQRAHSQLAQQRVGTIALAAELSQLDQQHSALQQADHHPELPQQLSSLGQAYDDWYEKARKQDHEMRALETAADQARETLQRLQRTFRHPERSPSKPKKKAVDQPTEQHKAQLSELDIRYTALHQEWKAHNFEDRSEHALQNRQRLLADFTTLRDHSLNLWELALPLAFAAYQREQSQYRSAIASHSSSDSSSWDSSSSSSSSDSSSDSSSWDSSSSSSSSDSSDGGSW